MQRPLLLVLVAGCSGSSTSMPPDASTYIPPDAACAEDNELYAGGIVDFESSTDVLAGGSVVLRADPSRSTVTDPSGRFELCAPRRETFILDIGAAGDALGGTMYEASRPFERPYLPMFTPSTLDAVLARVGKTFDATKGAIVTVAFSDGAQLDGTQPALVFEDGAWTPGGYGDARLFPDVTPGMHKLGNAGNPGFDIEIAAGQITWVGLPPIYIGAQH